MSMESRLMTPLPLNEMSPVELPTVSENVTLKDIEVLRALRQQHKQELQEYEDETRRQRHQLRKMKKAVEREKSSVDSLENIPPRDQNGQTEVQLANEKAALEVVKAKAAELEEVDRVERERFLVERAGMEEKLLKLREQRLEEERLMQEVCKPSVGNLFCSIEEPISSVPSAVPSVVSSAAPSRCSSPTGSDAIGRCSIVSSMPIVAVADAVDSSDARTTGKGGPAASVAVAAPPQGKKGGKGKGKGCAPMPPPPTGGLKTPRHSLAGPPGAPARPSKYVNLYWKATQKPEVVDVAAFENDPYLIKLGESGLRAHLGDVPVDSPWLKLPESLIEAEAPPLPETIFSAGVEVPELPEQMLDAYFKRVELTVRLPQLDNVSQNQSIAGRSNLLGDQKRLNMIGIMLQKHLMKHKEESNREAILNIKRGVLQCDFNMVKLECLSVIRTVVRQHVNDGSPLNAHVQSHGEAAIWDLAYPDHHYLVYELSKVPQIDERLECMMFHIGFCEMMVTSKQNLETLLKALHALKAKRHLIQRFFVTAHRLGQSLSQKPSRGFQLSTLDKLTVTKSTKMPHLSILHFVLALMSREDALELFSDEDISLLKGAKALGTAKVCDECRELAQGLYGVKQICESGEYTCQSTGQSVKIQRRRKTLPPGAAAAALHGDPAGHKPAPAPATVEDPDDCFHEVMRTFVESHVDEAEDIAVECHQMLLLYKELALFFDDLNNVYPPPKEPSDKKFDLLDVFSRFATAVPRHLEEVENEGLRSLIGNGEG